MHKYNIENLYPQISISTFGIEQCNPLHFYGPAVRDHLLIVSVLKGKGIFKTKNKTYRVKTKEAFIIRPNEIHFYQADKHEPWKYAWFGLKGANAISIINTISEHKDIIHVSNINLIENCITKLTQYSDLKIGFDTRSLGYFYVFLSELMESNNLHSLNNKDITKDYVMKAITYIEGNYSKKIEVKEIAKYLNLNRVYFTRLFTKYMKSSPQDYIINYKIKKACQLLKETNLSIHAISNSVGYQDALNFSKLFKQKLGIPPTEYRKI